MIFISRSFRVKTTTFTANSTSSSFNLRLVSSIFFTRALTSRFARLVISILAAINPSVDVADDALRSRCPSSISSMSGEGEFPSSRVEKRGKKDIFREPTLNGKEMGSTSSILEDESIDAISDEIRALDNAIRRAPEETHHRIRDYRKRMYVRKPRILHLFLYSI